MWTTRTGRLVRGFVSAVDGSVQPYGLIVPAHYHAKRAMRLDVVSDTEMMLFFSRDQGKTWSNPLPVLSGQTVSETDFVELPSGDLLLINNSIFSCHCIDSDFVLNLHNDVVLVIS